MSSIRQEFSETMLEVGQKDPNLIVLIGDISHFILQPFAKACPGRFYNVGICENTIVNMAAGLSLLGFYPVIHTIAPFIVERSFEQIKLDFGYQKLGVNIVTVGSAFDNAALGCTHHCYDDFALLKNVPGMQIIYPASRIEFNRLFKQTYNNHQSTYFRVPEHQHQTKIKPSKIKFGKAIKITGGKDITLIAVGSQLDTAVNSVPLFKKLGLNPEILYIHTIKPLDMQTIKKSLKKTGKCLVIEEHSMYGGVYDDVLRAFANLPKVRFAGLNLGDKFIHEYGSYEQLCHKLNLSPRGIIKRAKKIL